MRLGWDEGTGTGMRWKVRGSKFDELGEKWLLQREVKIMTREEWERENQKAEEEKGEGSGSDGEM